MYITRINKNMVSAFCCIGYQKFQLGWVSTIYIILLQNLLVIKPFRLGWVETHPIKNQK